MSHIKREEGEVWRRISMAEGSEFIHSFIIRKVFIEYLGLGMK